MNLSKLKKSKKVLTVSIIVIMMIITLSSVAIIQIKNTADAYVEVPSGTIANLYNDTSKIFVKNNLDLLAQSANYSDIESMIDSVKGGDIKISTGFASDTTVKLGTYYNLTTRTYEDLVWIPVYLSKDITGSTAILTLWLASVDTTEQASNQERSTWTDGTYTTTKDYVRNGMVCNSYDGSYIRNVTLNNGSSYLGNWGMGTAVALPDYTYPTKDKTKNKFVDFTTGELKDFIATPSQVPWQMNQGGAPNDVLYDHTKNPSGNGTNTAYYPTNWTNDKIWLPSIDDLCYVDGTWLKYNNLWQLSFDQEVSYMPADFYNSAENMKSWYCTRNGGHSGTTQYCVESKDVTIENNDINQKSMRRQVNEGFYQFWVRPAIHLDLSLALEGSKRDIPQDVSVEYSGLPLNFSAVTTTPDWYLSNVMTVAFADGSTGKTDCGEYDMIATIKDEFVSQDVKFKGNPKSGETETSRKFKFKIVKKKIGGTMSLVDNIPQFTPSSGAINSADTTANGRAPNFGLEYKNKVTGQAYDDYPTGIVGTYTATVKMLNETNYVLDKAYSIDFTIEKTKVAKPSISTREKSYTGEAITFNLTQISDKVSVTVTGDGAEYNYGVVTVRNAGTYTVNISLADNGESTCWSTSTDTNEDIASYTIDITVTQKKLNTDISCSESAFSWEAGETPTMTITDERFSGDIIDYYVYYLKSGDSTKYDDIDANKQTVGDSVIVTMPSDLSIGSYTFVVELKSKSSSNNNGNYYIDGESKTRAFSVNGNGITVNGDSIKWKVNSVDIGQSASEKLSLTYNGNSFTFSVDESNLQSLGVKIDTSKGTRGLEGDIVQTDAGTSYSVTVWLCNYNNMFDEYSGSFTLNYEIKQAKYNLSNVKWNYTEGTLKYNGSRQSVVLAGLPSGLSVTDYDNNEQRNAGDYEASVLGFNNTNSNYVTPLVNNADTYEGTFAWTLNWSIGKATLDLTWESTDIGKDFKVQQVVGSNAQYIDGYKYYKSNGASIGEEIDIDDIVVGDSSVRYWVEAVLTASASINFEISQSTKTISFKVGNDNEKITVELTSNSFTYDGNAHGGSLKVTQGMFDVSKINKTYYKDSVAPSNKLEGEPIDAGNYILVLSLNEEDEEEYALSNTQLPFTIEKAKITAQWDTSSQVPVLSNLSETQKLVVGYIYYDEDGNEVPDGTKLEVGKTYKVKAIITGTNVSNYEFVAIDGTVLPSESETQVQDFTLNASGTNQGGSGSNVGIGSGNNGGGMTIDDLLASLDGIPLWQLIASIISIMLLIIFIPVSISLANKRKRIKKTIDNRYKTYYAGAFLGLFEGGWTAIAITLMVLAVGMIVIAIIQKSLYNKAEDELEDAKVEYERNQADIENKKRDENMRMILMSMMGGQGNNGNMGQGGYVVQQSIGAEDIRGIVSETVTALLPNVQQALPQQASTNDETIKTLVEGQKMIMQRLAELSANQNTQPQVIEKEVIKEVPVEVEKIVEKEVPVEKIVEKEVRVEVPVEKVVEKEVVKEVKVEVPVVAPTPAKPKKEVAPRLTLDEAYAQLSKQQQKYFDGLREYALTKDKCKEKKSTYFVVFGQSTINPLMKLTIKKGKTVALFKMEDEYMKDIRRDATSDGTKVKVKETEVVIADAQSCKVAKNMIDLREDQIERYQDLLKEQRAVSKKRK